MLSGSFAGPGYILFSGSNDRAVLALCRGFANCGAPFALIGREANDLLDQSMYADRYLSYRTKGKLELRGLLAAVEEARSRTGNERWVLCPTSEYLNLKLFGMRSELAVHGISVATCSEGLYRELSDKSTFRKFCERNGVGLPLILDENDAARTKLPYVAKPKSNLTNSGSILYPYLVHTEEDRALFLNEMDTKDYYLEEFVLGESWYLLYYFGANGVVASGAQRNILQQGLGKSIVVAQARPYPEPGTIGRVEKILIKAGYTGFIMLEIRRKSDGRVVAIEANPRCWGPYQLTLDANMGLMETFLEDHGSQSIALGPFRKASYCWSGGIIQAIRSGKGLDPHVPVLRVLGATMRGLLSDVYARKGSWSCFLSDLWRS